MSRVEAFRDTNLRSLLKELRTDIAMAVDDPFPLVYGLADKNIITEQLLKVSHRNTLEISTEVRTSCLISLSYCMKIVLLISHFSLQASIQNIEAMKSF